MIQHGIFPYFRPCISTTCRAENPLIFKEYSIILPFYYKLPGDETNIICLDTLVLVTGIDIYFVATSFSSVRNFINSSSTNVRVQLLNNSVHPHRCIGQNCDLHRLRQWVSCLPHLRLPASPQSKSASHTAYRLILGTKQPQRRQNDCLSATGIISFTLFIHDNRMLAERAFYCLP